MAITDVKARTATVPAGKKQIKISDGGGLYLLVKPAGKYWRMDYRFGGTRKTIAFGKYPKVTLKKARSMRDEAKDLLDQNIDPSRKKKIDKISANTNTFSELAAEWMKKQQEAWTDSTRKANQARLDNHILPWIGSFPIVDIETPELLAVIRRVEDRSNIETGRRLKSLMSRVFKYGMAIGKVKYDPTDGLTGALAKVSVKHRPAITEPKKVGELLQAISAFTGTFIVQQALRLSPYVFLRPGELRHGEWSEIDFDAAEWRIPVAKMKKDVTHIVPLSVQAIEILRDIQPLTGRGKYIFPSSRGKGRPMSENTINASLKRLGYTKDDMCAHGFRGLASTLLHEQGWDSDVIERQLAHKEGNKVKAAYNHARHLPERRKMMQVWADYLDELRLQAQM